MSNKDIKTEAMHDSFEGNYFQVPNEFIERMSPYITTAAHAVYMVIKRHAKRKTGYAYPGLKRIGELAGIKSRTTTIKAIACLERYGLLIVERSKDEDGIKNVRNEYWVTTPSQWPNNSVVQNIYANSTDNALLSSTDNEHKQDEPNKTKENKSRHQSSKQKTPGAYTIPAPENTERDPLVALWEKVGGVLTGSVAEYIADWQNTYSSKEVETAIGIAGRKGKLQVKYVEGILRNQASEVAAKEAQASRESSLDRKLMNAAKPYEVDTSMADTNAALLEKMRKNNG